MRKNICSLTAWALCLLSGQVFARWIAGNVITMNSTFEIIRVAKQEARPFQESVHWFAFDQLEQSQ